MSHWRRLSRKHRTLYLVIALLALAATALASGRLTTGKLTSAEDSPVVPNIDAPLPPPAAVFLQKTEEFPKLGNALLVAQLTPEQREEKVKAGTGQVATLGEILLRDDGKGGDAKASDGLFTGVVRVDEDELKSRNAQDKKVLADGKSGEVALFSDRTLAGTVKQEAFDIDGFEQGALVRLAMPVIPPPPTWPGGGPTTTFQDRVLMIRDPGVVTDPRRTIDPCTFAGTAGGEWTFGNLMTQMANRTASGINPSVFAETWLQNWTANQTINTFGVPSRVQMQAIINQWRTESGGGLLDLDKAPVRLLAVVSRVDLRRTRGGGGGYGGSSNGDFLDAGEARFIFGFVLRPGWRLAGGYGTGNSPQINPNGCRALPFSVIFEYRVPKCDCPSVRDWAQRWIDLNGFVPGTSAYNDRLAALTRQFVNANSNPSRPNGSAIGQVRTNEVALQVPWQLREFQLTQFPWSHLNETTTNDTADDSFNNSWTWQSWITTQAGPRLFASSWSQGIPVVPLYYPTGNFQGARPEMPNATFFWNAPGLNLAPGGGNNRDNWGRHRTSLASCNGCHAGETHTNFVHVDPSSATLPASLSGFLTGVTVGDPANGGAPVRTFADLARREADLRSVSRLSCTSGPRADISAVSLSLALTGTIPDNPFPETIGPDQLISFSADDLVANHVLEVH